MARTRTDLNDRQNACGGFTMVELLLVMAVVVAAISVAGPSLANFFRGRTLDSEARRLLALTHAGESRAVSEGVPMRLWVDVDQKSYGLKEEPGWNEKEQDPKEVEFELDKDLKLEIIRADKGKTVNAFGFTLQQPNFSQKPQDSKEDLPTIQFLPDGTIEEGAPKAVRLTDRDGVSIWLAQTEDRTRYEIRNTEPE